MRSAVRMRRRRVALTINRRRRTLDPVFREPAQLHHCYFLLVEPRSYFYGPRYSLILMPSRQTVCCSAPLKLFDSVSPPVCIVCNWYLKECRTVRSGSFEFFPPWRVTCQVNASLQNRVNSFYSWTCVESTVRNMLRGFVFFMFSITRSNWSDWFRLGNLLIPGWLRNYTWINNRNVLAMTSVQMNPGVALPNLEHAFLLSMQL